ncbi:MAG: hypothetical protein JNK87_22155 [Bryobacterales bacterium]|nr:hypothetical protein [Bryobacterales bacterium]
MGFALWSEQEIAWALGTHEYRPMGVAVIASNGQFRARDFKPRGRVPKRDRLLFRGFFASLEDMNQYLAGGQRRRKSGNASKAMQIL